MAALVTGASGGIGMELARLFAADGINVVLTARNAEKLEQLEKQLQTLCAITAYTIPADLADHDAPQQIFNRTRRLGIDVDYLVNNAGFGQLGRFDTSDRQRFSQMICLNVLALTHLTRLYLPNMVAKKSGRVLNIASAAAFVPGPFVAVYFAIRACVLSFFQAIAEELEGTGVTVTALCPGPTASGFQKAADTEDIPLVKNRKLPTSAEVARYGYIAMKKAKRVAVHGLMNRMLILSTRLAPGRTLTRAVRRINQPD